MSAYPALGEGSKRKAYFGALVMALVVALLAGYLATRGHPSPPVASALKGNQANYAQARGSYATNFAIAESPISEGSRWINGQTDGVDWANVRTIPGLAYGTQSGKKEFNDSVALLAGNWGANQTVEATVHAVNQNNTIFEEVELRLRSSVSPHHATGYEIMFRCSKTSDAYTAIARWNGAWGKFTSLGSAGGARYGVADGDVVKATIVGNVITAYINGVQVLQATDSTYTAGNPGIGFCLWLNPNDGLLRRIRMHLLNDEGLNGDFGFTNFKAVDGSS